MRSRLTGVLALLALPLAVMACGEESSSKKGQGESSKTITVGSPTDESGDYALIGSNWKKGQTAAQAYINENGGILGRKLVIEREDSQSDPNRVATVTNKMIQSGKYAALLPAAGGIVSGPMYQAVTRGKMLALSGGDLPNLADPKVYPTAFESSYSPTELGDNAACMVPALGFKSVGILGLNDSFSQTQVKRWIAKYKELGIKVTGNEKMGQTDKSATAQVQRLQSGNPEALQVILFGPPVGAAFSALKSLGWDPPIVGEMSVATFPLEEVAKPDTFPSKVYGLGTPSTARLKSGYTEAQKIAIKYMKSANKMDHFDAALNTYMYGYDAVMLYKWGVEKAGTTDQDKVIAALEGLKDNPESTGAVNQDKPPISAEHHGLNDGEMYLLDLRSKYEDGTFAAIKPIPHC